MLEWLGFSEAAATYLTGTCGIDSLDEIAYLDGIEDVNMMIKGVTKWEGLWRQEVEPQELLHVTMGYLSPSEQWLTWNFVYIIWNTWKGFSVSLLTMQSTWFWFTVIATNNVMKLVSRRQQKNLKLITKIGQGPWKIKEYFASQYGVTGATLDYVVRPDIAVKPEAEDPAENYETVDQEMMAIAPHTGRSFVDNRRKAWDIMSNICGKHSCFVYIKPA
jgi:hypothetical protein